MAIELGIIPAYAGSTLRRQGPHQEQKDHPRVCGEHLSQPVWSPLVPGSSPRMRGAPGLFRRWRLLAGIIPAYAGSTTVPAARRSV